MEDNNDNNKNPDDRPNETAEQLDMPASDQAPEDALSRTPEDLEQEEIETAAANSPKDIDSPTTKKQSPFIKILKRVNVYFLIFLILIAIAGAITVVNYLNSQKIEPTIELANQELTEDALKQLSNNYASVGTSTQTLTIQGNAVINGQTLMRGNLNVAGNIQSGGSLQGSSLTVSGNSSLGQTQINGLQVASELAVQGGTSLQGLSVAGNGSFGGGLTASEITTSRLVLSGNATIDVPNHIRFSGPSPGRTVNPGVLGGGGSASVNGSDTAGTVNINTGNNPTAGCFTRINFNQPFPKQPYVVISPVGPGAGLTSYYVDRNTTGFSVCAATPAPANQAFAFDYFVTY